MSNTFKKTTLGTALALALCAAPAAFAYDAGTGVIPAGAVAGNNAGEAIASQVGTTVTMTEEVNLGVVLGDALVGRTTGFQIKITLQGSAKFAAPAPVFADAVGGSLVDADWNIITAAGGTVGSNIVQYSVQPDPVGAGSGVGAGTIGGIAGLSLTGVSTTVPTTATIEIIDPVGAVSFFADTFELITRNDGLATTCVAGGLDQIDVGVNAMFPDQKTGFVSTPYTIGAADHTLVDLGAITLATSSGFTLDVAPAGDTFYSQVTGTDLSAFAGIFLATDATCLVPIAGGDYTIAGNVATLDVEFAALGGTFVAAGGSATLCADVDGTTAIAAQTLTVLNGINGAADTDVACNVMPLEYNGSVVEVYHLNPAGNTAAQSFLRVINPSSLPGLVTVEGIDDGANAAAAPITFTLGAGESKQLNSEVLENGGAGVTGAWGNGVGKWRATVTGEFAGMRVQGLNRNTTDNTVTNLTDADGKGEQTADRDL